MSLNKWKKCITKVFHDEGFKVKEIKQSKNHFKIYSVLPLGEERMFVTCITPSDNRKVLLNFRADVRRAVKHERENDYSDRA